MFDMGRLARLLILFLALAVGSTACEGPEAGEMLVTDSAGVRLTLTPDDEVVYAVVDAEPILSLGGPDAVGPELFHRVQKVLVDGTGKVWVADGQSNELRLFGSDGNHLRTRGGTGDGPGEFRRIRLLGVFRGDSVAVWDGGLGRLSVFDPDGELGQVLSLSGLPSGESVPRGFDVFDDGTILAQIPVLIPAGSIEAGQTLGDSARLVRIDLRGSTSVAQGSALGPTWIWTGRSQIPVPFTINSSFDIWDGSVHLVSGPQFRIRVFRDGALAEVYGVGRSERQVSQEDLATYRAFVEEYIPDSQKADYLETLDHPLRPTVLPAYSQVVLASDGHTWARLYSPDPSAAGRWDVFRPDGVWVGEVETPVGFVPMSISDDLMAGVWRDGLGVEYVRVYGFRTDTLQGGS